jgi:hypothetical protein
MKQLLRTLTTYNLYISDEIVTRYLCLFFGEILLRRVITYLRAQIHLVVVHYVEILIK